MVDENETLSAEDIKRIADLHSMSLPGSILTHLGAKTVERLYQFVIQSNQEYLFLIRLDGQIQAASVLSMDAKTLMRRFVLDGMLSFSFALLSAFVTSTTFQVRIMNYVKEIISCKKSNLNIPECTHIFTNPSYRNRKLGTQLINCMEQCVLKHGIDQYYVRVPSNNENTIRFYERNNFKFSEHITFCGEEYLIMVKYVP